MSNTQPTTLYEHVAHPHTPRNPNDVHRAEHQARVAQGGLAAFNQRLAVWLTAYVGTMFTAYGFAALAIVGLAGVLAILNPSVYTFIAWLSQTFIQLVLLPVIMVGQNVLNRRTEIQATEMYHNVVRILHDMQQQQAHLTAQDAELLKQTALLARLAIPSTPSSASSVPAVLDATVNGTTTTNSAGPSHVRVDVPSGPASAASSVRSRQSRAAKPQTAKPKATAALTPQQRRSDPPDPSYNDS